MTLSATPRISVTAGCHRPPAWGEAVRILTACVLLLASGLKGYQLSTEPVLSGDLFSNRWLLALGVEFEIIMGLWLLSGLRRRLSCLVAAVAFGVFSVITLYKGISGELSCGCFGRVEISPWYTLILDISLLVGLMAFRPRSGVAIQRAGFRKIRFSVATSAALVACLTAGISMASYRPARLSDDGAIIGDDRFVVLEPQQWIGKRLPLLGHIDLGDQLARGQWTLVLYHHDCPHCQESLPQIKKLAGTFLNTKSSSSKSNTGGRFALVEMPPYTPKDSDAAVSKLNCTTAKLSNSRDWFAVTPTLLSLKDGKVTTVVEGDITDAPASPGHADRTAAAATRGTPGSRKTDAVGVAVSGKAAAHDFGYVKVKAKRSVIFNISNPGGKLLKVRKVRSECKCMLAPAPPKAIAAKGITPVRVDFIAPDKPMRYSKRILVQTDSPERPVIVLRVEADVGRPLYVKPSVLDLGEIAAGVEFKATVTLINHSDKPVRLAYGTSTSSECIARVPRASIGCAGGKLSLPIAIKPARAGDRGKATIHIHTDCPTQQRVDLQVKYVVASPVAQHNPQDRQLARDTRNK
jgi:hypothetical protein